ncbi:MAG: rhodanese-like domain-containing protein [bacterium]|nr:rhodanese-like domain-containing protein [bacterium]
MRFQRLSHVHLFQTLFALLVASTFGVHLRAQERVRQLLDAKQLSSELQAFYVVDVREKSAYAAGHIPGSRWLDSRQWQTESLMENGLTDADAWNGRVQLLGLDNDKPTVVVGESITTTARIWWLLKYLGLKDVRLVDGDFKAWSQADLPLTTETVAIEPSAYSVDFRKERLATLEQVTMIANGDGDVKVLDNRSLQEYSGEEGSEGGHIPDAVHLEWNMFLDEEGRFLPTDKIQALLAEKQVDLSDPVVAHCRTGARCSVAVFALELAGAADVKNYYRGWSEYAVQKSAVIEK